MTVKVPRNVTKSGKDAVGTREFALNQFGVGRHAPGASAQGGVEIHSFVDAVTEG